MTAIFVTKLKLWMNGIFSMAIPNILQVIIAPSNVGLFLSSFRYKVLRNLAIVYIATRYIKCSITDFISLLLTGNTSYKFIIFHSPFKKKIQYKLNIHLLCRC
nr:MAG TPA: hypothetical protein [Caudoviricetes sp.]